MIAGAGVGGVEELLQLVDIRWGFMHGGLLGTSWDCQWSSAVGTSGRSTSVCAVRPNDRGVLIATPAAMVASAAAARYPSRYPSVAAAITAGREPTMAKTVREPLNDDRICAAALRLIDQHGIDALSMRRLGTELGVDPMAVYRHIPGKDELLKAIVRRVFAQMPVPADTGPWATRVQHWARAYRSVAQAHPNLVLRIVTEPAVVAVAAVQANEALYRARDVAPSPVGHRAPPTSSSTSSTVRCWPTSPSPLTSTPRPSSWPLRPRRHPGRPRIAERRLTASVLQRGALP